MQLAKNRFQVASVISAHLTIVLVYSSFEKLHRYCDRRLTILCPCLFESKTWTSGRAFKFKNGNPNDPLSAQVSSGFQVSWTCALDRNRDLGQRRFESMFGQFDSFKIHSVVCPYLLTRVKTLPLVFHFVQMRAFSHRSTT